ncbi:uncharacterized protein AC631_02156 [Debaryomyces fabryi]|uniref:proline--tRNA ligase n=1 Tax=Debaryomyces fabryi TaxID=58627 RepID=A0A0V1Q0X5_9ASCO|nr:uncharacterized protein AC631_02156 [Debaryomyces fabryi]KSA02082.1 hypothetical protein AC631_02156 [Debaryomyces fabryi]CUM51112.1 unnamed protein product [Debaryomyces fabryi]
MIGVRASRYRHLAIRSIHTPTVPKLYLNNVELSGNDLRNIPTHELFTKFGFIHHPKPGLVHWLPVGLAISQKVSQVIHHRMRECDAEEINLSLLSSSQLWQETGRWDNTELFKLKDSSKNDFCLVATCEEEITKLVSSNINSYKNLPLLYYQINEKFRDEKRPRSGLLRGREFLMKDAYSFDLNEEAAMETYNKVVDAYYEIFQDLKIPFVKADADTGEIGGSLSHEWHYLHNVGEDTLFTCDECGNSSNIEKTLSFPEDVDESIDVSVQYFMTKDKGTLVCAYYPTERSIEPSFVKEEIPDLDLIETNQDTILNEFSNEDTLISKKIIRIMDSRLNLRSNFPDFPIKFINRSLITTLTDIPIVTAVENEICAKCEDGHLKLHRAIEVGHTFYLGDKYSDPLKCEVEVPNTEGGLTFTNVLMGCYGIGISRIIAAIGEINKDSNGFRWPSIIAPWNVTVVQSPKFDNSKGSLVYELLNAAGISYRLDNRPKIGLGKKIKQSHMVGIPLTVILGNQFPLVEIEIRGRRYTDDLQWKRLYETRDFEWEIVTDAEGNDIKHLVHIDGVASAINSLLIDM